MSMQNFNARPKSNERHDAITYVNQLISQAKSHDSHDDIVKLEKIIKLLRAKKYGLVWEEHSEKVEKQMETQIPVFVENLKNKITGDKNSETYNFLLEGDNLHSLNLLEKTHINKIDTIYIDPPYNTGKKDFKYNDAFVREDDEFKHSMWLSFMSKRLKIAKKLLKKDGIIFVSIGDEEYAQLKLLMDDVFGEKTYRDTLMIEISATTGQKVAAAKKGGIVKNGEYILVYSQSDLTSTKRQPLYDWVPGFDTHFTLYLNDDGSISKTIDILKNDKKIVEEFARISNNHDKLSLKNFSKYFNYSTVFTDFVKSNVKKFARARSEVPYLSGKVINELSENRWYKYNSSKREDPYYLTLEKGKPINLATMQPTYHWTDDFNPVYGRSTIRGDFWKGFWVDMGNIGKEGGVSLKNGKKPKRLIKQLLKWANRPNGTVLDFFAGSGTTGHAVLELNKEDKGHRKFILATNDEVVETAYTRMINVNDKFPLNLKYFKTSFVDKESFPNISLEYELLKYVTPLVELEFSVDITNPRVQIILNEQQLKKLIETDQLVSASTIFIHPDVFLDAQQAQILQDLKIEIQEIPNYFFGKELWTK